MTNSQRAHSLWSATWWGFSRRWFDEDWRWLMKSSDWWRLLLAVRRRFEQKPNWRQRASGS